MVADKVKVLVIDDSAMMRRLLTDLLNSDSTLEVVGAAADPFAARALIKELRPDVLTLDVEMPKMDGIQFLSNLMRLRPMPVVMISSVTTKGAVKTLQALELGAIDFVSKPKRDTANAVESFASEVIAKVKLAAYSRNSAGVSLTGIGERNVTGNQTGYQSPITPDSAEPHPNSVFAIGASTGGTEAIRQLLEQMPLTCPGILVAQHMPPVFTQSFASRLNDCCRINVCEAKDGQAIVPGTAYIARGDRHLEIREENGRLFCDVWDGEPVNGHKPSIDVLFESVAAVVGPSAKAALLTGMGKDGAVGLLKLRRAGAFTIAQDESSSIIWGMPRVAIQMSAADVVLPLPQIAGQFLDLSVAKVS